MTTPPGNYALRFDGTNGYVDFGTWFDYPSFTVSFWANPDSIQQSGAALVDLQNDLALYSNPTLANNYILLHLMQQDLLPNQWQHITITVDGTTDIRKMYVNGQLVQTNYWAYAPSTHNLRLA